MNRFIEKREAHHARSVRFSRARARRDTGGGGIGLASGQDPDPATVDFPTSTSGIRCRRIRTMSRACGRSSRTTTTAPRCGSATARARAAGSRGSPPPAHRGRTRTPKTVTTSRPQRLADRPQGRVRDARPARRRGRGRRAADLEHLGNTTSATDTLRRVIGSDITREEGQDGPPPIYPTAASCFSSTAQRQAKAILLDEGKPSFEAANEARGESAFVMHG